MKNNMLKISRSEFLANLGSLENEMQNISNLLANVKSKTNKMNTYWQGNDSDIMDSSIKNFITCFDNINIQNKVYIDFLVDTINNYCTFDDSVASEANDNKGLRINGS